MGKDYFVTFENYIEIRFQSDQIKVLGTSWPFAYRAPLTA